MGDERRTVRHPLRWAAGLAVAAVGATAAFDRLRGHRRGKAGGASPTFAEKQEAEFKVGRGEPATKPSRASEQAGYELDDTRVRDLVLIMVVSLVMMVGAVTGVFFMYSSFDRHFLAANASMTSQQKTQLMPPLPHLQAEPYRDIDAVLMEQEHRLTTYGWNSADHANGHIPIERAMQQIVGKPLDSAAQADAVRAAGTAKSMPETPAFSAVRETNKPANRIQGEGRPGAVAPSFDPAEDAKAEHDKAEDESK